MGALGTGRPSSFTRLRALAPRIRIRRLSRGVVFRAAIIMRRRAFVRMFIDRWQFGLRGGGWLIYVLRWAWVGSSKCWWRVRCG